MKNIYALLLIIMTFQVTHCNNRKPRNVDPSPPKPQDDEEQEEDTTDFDNMEDFEETSILN